MTGSVAIQEAVRPYREANTPGAQCMLVSLVLVLNRIVLLRETKVPRIWEALSPGDGGVNA